MIDDRQAKHFDEKENRYKATLIANPPKYTKVEVGHILTEIKKRKIGAVVDFGSGNGRLTIPLLQNGIHVVAVDISQKSLKALTDRVVEMDIPPRLLKTSHVFPASGSDAIVGCDILHHIDMKEYLPEMRKKLNPKGVLIFSEPNFLNIAWTFLIAFTIDWRIEWRIIYNNYFILMRQLRNNDFKKVKIKGLGLVPPPLLNSFDFLQKINYKLGDMFFLKLFAYRYIIVAEKD